MLKRIKGLIDLDSPEPQPSDLFDRLVDNALDFLDRSIADFEKSPKYSVIHFYTAVELFVKARLMAEHWSLMVAKGQEPSREGFLKGGFLSVTLAQASDRLANVLNAGLTDAELKAFQKVGAHRNKVVHFFHEAHTAKANASFKESIAKEQLIAWYFLHKILTTRWKDVFKRKLKKIQKIDMALRKRQVFLQVVYDIKKPDIEAARKKGTEHQSCPSCGFVSIELEDTLNRIFESSCVVCELSQKYLIVECPECDEKLTFVGEGWGECSCGKKFEPDDIADLLLDSAAAQSAIMDGDDRWNLGNCSDCEGHHTVVRVDDGYVCANCFLEVDSMENCGWCNELNTGDMEFSYSSGCNHCEGKAGWERDD
jgi:hypothetical protein